MMRPWNCYIKPEDCVIWNYSLWSKRNGVTVPGSVKKNPRLDVALSSMV